MSSSFDLGYQDVSPSSVQPEQLRFASRRPPSTLATYGVLVLISIYYFLHYLEYVNLPLSEIIWNSVVYITSQRVVAFFDPEFPILNSQAATAMKGFDSIHHANKSNSLRKTFGIGGSTVMSVVNRGRSISDLGGSFKAKPVESLPGLGNWDHSCYQNSVIQGLASFQGLSEYLTPTRDETQGPTTKALREITEKLNDEESAGKTFWTPGELKSMSSWQQQDAQEYFSKIMDSLDKDTASFRARNRRSLGLQYLANRVPKHKVKSQASAESLESSSPSDDNRVKERTVGACVDDVQGVKARNPLDGLLAQRVGCQKCGYVEGLSLVPFNCLTLSLGRDRLYDVRECLDGYTALEAINGVECTNCTLAEARTRTAQFYARTQATAKEGSTEKEQAVGFDELLESTSKRLATITQILQDDDFSDGVLKKCQIPPKYYVKTTKSRQAVFARPPQSLVIHFNRSIFDELTGVQSKNQAIVQFPKRLDLGPWCLGSQQRSSSSEAIIESWHLDPMQSMLGSVDNSDGISGPSYELRAVITHSGRHENGHYVCWRRTPYRVKDSQPSEDSPSDEPLWWRLSDEDVTRVGEETVLAQGGVFMLFYEQIVDIQSPLVKVPPTDAQDAAQQTRLSSPFTAADAPVKLDMASLHEAAASRLPAGTVSIPNQMPDVLHERANMHGGGVGPATIDGTSEEVLDTAKLPLTSTEGAPASSESVLPSATTLPVPAASDPSPPSPSGPSLNRPPTMDAVTTQMSPPPVKAIAPRSGRDTPPRTRKSGMQPMTGVVQAN